MFWQSNIKHQLESYSSSCYFTLEAIDNAYFLCKSLVMLRCTIWHWPVHKEALGTSMLDTMMRSLYHLCVSEKFSTKYCTIKDLRRDQKFLVGQWRFPSSQPWCNIQLAAEDALALIMDQNRTPGVLSPLANGTLTSVNIENQFCQAYIKVLSMTLLSHI